MATMTSLQSLTLAKFPSLSFLTPTSFKFLDPFPASLSPSATSFTATASVFSPIRPTKPKRISLVTHASSTTAFPQNIGDVLADVTIFTATGESVKFEDLWDQNEGVAVVALLRHFGCPCCWELAKALKESRERFESAGVKLIAVGIGAPSKARILAERLPFPLDCLYADPDRRAYDVLGLYYGFGRTFFNPASAKVLSRLKELQEATKNYTIEATPDDRSGVLQQGGMFLFKGKQLLYAWKDEGTGDHAPMEDIFHVCCKVPVV
ncbi:thioredoxin-like protein AAED1, chloroplastic [Nicotiana tabacum]|uniref:Thioredoxin-like protein AAED1, chloroplastic n=1 Tax=Nicotiana tabacum TaxID=4097 RepID=A0AC58SZM6_TOBAC